MSRASAPGNPQLEEAAVAADTKTDRSRRKCQGHAACYIMEIVALCQAILQRRTSSQNASALIPIQESREKNVPPEAWCAEFTSTLRHLETVATLATGDLLLPGNGAGVHEASSIVLPFTCRMSSCKPSWSVVLADFRLADLESLAQIAFDADALSDRSPVSFSPYHSKHSLTIASLRVQQPRVVWGLIRACVHEFFSVWRMLPPHR